MKHRPCAPFSSLSSSFSSYKKNHPSPIFLFLPLLVLLLLTLSFSLFLLSIHPIQKLASLSTPDPLTRPSPVCPSSSIYSSGLQPSRLGSLTRLRPTMKIQTMSLASCMTHKHHIYSSYLFILLSLPEVTASVDGFPATPAQLVGWLGLTLGH